jgi:fission process protein 1
MLNSVISVKDQVLEGDVDTTETSARYLGLLGRIRPVLLPAARYLAYTS